MDFNHVQDKDSKPTEIYKPFYFSYKGVKINGGNL